MSQKSLFRKSRSGTAWLQSSVSIFTLLLAAPLSLVSNTTLAQGLDAADDEIQLEAIVVRARNRGEDVQDVPSSISVQDGETFAERGISDTKDIAKSTANVSTTGTGVSRFTHFIVRGGGSIGLDSPDDTSVVVTLNNSPLPKHLADSLLFDIEQVEVLRGPQGTHFGQNAQQGAINVRTRLPEEEFKVTLGGEWQSYGTSSFSDAADTLSYQGDVVVNLPVIQDKINTRFAARYKNKAGDIRDLVRNEEVGNIRDFAIRNTTQIFAYDDLDLLFSADYSNQLNDHPSWILKDSPGFPATSQAQQDETDQTSYGTGLTVNYGLTDDIELETVTTLRKIETDIFTDNLDPFMDGPPAAPLFMSLSTSDWDESFLKMDQEIKLKQDNPDGLTWVAGVNLGRTEFDAKIADSSTTAFGSNTTNIDINIDGQTYSAFGEATNAVTDRLKLTFGGRYSYDRKKADMSARSTLAPVPVRQLQSKSWSAFTGRLSASYNWTDDVMSYASVARGWKPGGFNRYPVNLIGGKTEQPFDASVSWTAEIGTKARIPDFDATFSAALFYTKTKDEQVSQFDLATNSLKIHNADVESYGFELEAAAELAEGLKLSSSLGLINTEFANTVAAAGVTKGRDVPNVPGVTGSIKLDYSKSFMANGREFTWDTNASWSYNGERKADNANSIKLKSYNLVDVTTGVSWTNGDTDRTAKVYIFARNILDEKYFTFAAKSLSGRVAAVHGAGRSLGLGAKFEF